MFNNDEVAAFVSSALSGGNGGTLLGMPSFTLTVAVPSDSGSLHGWSIHRLVVPGRYVTCFRYSDVKRDGLCIDLEG